MDVVWTRHAEERQRQWEKTMGITRAVVEEVVKSPPQVVEGDQGLKVAQGPWREGLVRVPFAESTTGRRIVTVYWTSRQAKYWRE